MSEAATAKPVIHGDYYKGYRRGCRLACCREANRVYCNDLSRRRRERMLAENPPKRKQVPVPSPVFPEGQSSTLRYRYRVDPSPEVEQKLRRLVGSARWVYNRAVAYLTRTDEQGKFLHPESFINHVVTTPRHDPETAWLAEMPYASLGSSARFAYAAMQAFWDSATGRRHGSKMRPPRFKKRSHGGSAHFPAPVFRINGGWSNTRLHGGRVRLSKIGEVSVRWSRPLPSDPSSVTILLEPDGTWWASFVVEAPLRPTTPQVPGRIAALDLGLTGLATVAYSDGSRETFPAPRFLRRAEHKIASLQRALARKTRGSKNYDDARRLLARAHKTLTRQRENYARQVAATLIRENQTVIVDQLSIAGLARTRLGKSTLDAGWGVLLRFLDEGARMRGREIVRLPAFFPGTRTCSQCGTDGGKKPLHVREWECAACGALLDRDYNAAINHLAYADPEAASAVKGLALVVLAPGLRARVKARRGAVSRPSELLARGGAGTDTAGSGGRKTRRPHRHDRRRRRQDALARYEHARKPTSPSSLCMWSVNDRGRIPSPGAMNFPQKDASK